MESPGSESSSLGTFKPQKHQRKGSFMMFSRKISQSASDPAPVENGVLAVRTSRWQAFLRPLGRKVVPIADVGASIAEAVPLLGAPVKGALDALVKTLRIVEQRFQNEESVQQLLNSLAALSHHLGSNTGSNNVDWLRARLEEMEQKLKKLTSINGLDYANVASSISQCERDIATYIATFSASVTVETQAVVRVLEKKSDEVGMGLAAIQLELARQREHTSAAEERFALFLSSTVAPSRGPLPLYITVIDPFGTEHKLLQIPNSRYDLGIMVLERYQRNPMMWNLLAGFVESGGLDTSIDDYRRVIPLHQDDFNTLESNSTIVMSAVVTLKVARVGWAWCPICCDSIALAGESTERIICDSCDRNVQVLTIYDRRTQHPLELSKESHSDNFPIRGYPLGKKYLDHLRQIVISPKLTSIRYYKRDTNANATHSVLPVIKPIAFNGGSGIDYWAPVNIRLQEHRDDLSASIQFVGGLFRKILLDVIKLSEAIEWDALDQYVDEWLGLKGRLEEDPSLRNYEWLQWRLVEAHADLWTLITANDLNRHAVSRSMPQRDGLASCLARAVLASQIPPVDPTVAKIHKRFKIGGLPIWEALSRLLRASQAPTSGAIGVGAFGRRRIQFLECPACNTVILGPLEEDKRALCRTCDEYVEPIPLFLLEVPSAQESHYTKGLLKQSLLVVRSYTGTLCDPWSLNFPKRAIPTMPGILVGLGR